MTTHPRDAPVVGHGQAPGGETWQLRAQRGDADQLLSPGSVDLFIAFRRTDGRSIGGFGCSGVGFANEQRPVVLSVSGSHPTGSFCYVGQTIAAAETIELDLTDGSTVGAALVPTRLSISLWVAITDGGAVPVEIRAGNQEGTLGRESVDERWLQPRSSAVWGPIHE